MNEPRFEFRQEDMGGWVRVSLSRGEPTGELAKFLSHGLTRWARERPHLRIRCIVPISSNGDTTELHAWYDQVAFTDNSGMSS
jgi:hypothetical protein